MYVYGAAILLYYSTDPTIFGGDVWHVRLLLQEIQIGFSFTFLVPAHPGSSGQNPDSCKTVVV